jgi:mannose-1-phosphate guanylyltransferase / mannose-6-phosphate isomerase
MTVRVQPVILSGGSGSRLWPLSRDHLPKQFLPLTGETSLFQETLRRLAGMGSVRSSILVEPPLVVCNVAHRFLVEEQLRGAPAEIVVEPVSRNTAPALTLAALQVLGREQDPVLVVTPADHHVVDSDGFARTLVSAIALAERGAVATIGIAPTRPETGYGYLRCGPRMPETPALLVDRFVEKPDASTATTFLSSGEYLWNSGVFILRASRWMELIGQFAPLIERSCREALARPSSSAGLTMKVVSPDAEAFSRCPSDSIDYAVMERAAAQGCDVVVLPFVGGWSDVGDFSALAEVSELDTDHNLIRGDVVAMDTRDSVLLSGRRLVAVLGMSEAIVVETGDAVLVAHRSRSQDLRQLVQELKERGRTEAVLPYVINRPWGTYETLTEHPGYRVKRLIVNPGERLSLQLHHHRAEHWVVTRGCAHITRGNDIFDLGVNQSTYIPIGTKHRIANLGTEPLEIIEVQCGTYVGEDDIVRFEDEYDRVTRE